MKVKRQIDYLHLFRTSPYLIFNGILLVVLLGIFSYSAVYSAENNHYPIPSSLNILREGRGISSGLSHSFSELMRGRISSARHYNVYGPRIFLFFVVQLIMRPLFAILFVRNNQSTNWVFLDAGASSVFFLIAFWPFIVRLIEGIASL
jgi:hypothetical protein